MKHVVRKAFFDFKKEEKYLNEMSVKGLALTDCTWCRYRIISDFSILSFAVAVLLLIFIVVPQTGKIHKLKVEREVHE
jgi:hypothetical protein